MLLPEIKIEEKDYSTKIKTEPGSVYQYSSAVRIDRSERFVRGVDSIENILGLSFGLKKRIEIPF